MHRVYDIIERIGEPQNVALRNIVERVYHVDSSKEVVRTFHIFLGIISQLLCDRLISKDEMEILQELFNEYCTCRYNDLKEDEKENASTKKKYKLW